MGLGNVLKTGFRFIGLLSTADDHFRKYRFSQGFSVLESNAKSQTSTLISNEELIKNKYSEEIYELLLIIFKLREQLYLSLTKVSFYFETQNYDVMSAEIRETGKIFDKIGQGFINLEEKMRVLLRERSKMPIPRNYEERERDFESTQAQDRYYIIVKNDILSIPDSIQEQNTQHGKNVVFSKKIILVRNFINNKELSGLAELRTAA